MRQGKPLPSFVGTAAHQVRLTLEGGVRNPAFVRFMERLGEDTLRSFSTLDYLALERLEQNQPLAPALQEHLPNLVAAGAVESLGRGRGTRYILSEALYASLGAKGTACHIEAVHSHPEHWGMDASEPPFFAPTRSITAVSDPFSVNLTL